jgi:hypothetical protein
VLQACLQSPSVFELLPPLDFPYQQPSPQLRIWLAKPIPEGTSHLPAPRSSDSGSGSGMRLPVHLPPPWASSPRSHPLHDGPVLLQFQAREARSGSSSRSSNASYGSTFGRGINGILSRGAGGQAARRGLAAAGLASSRAPSTTARLTPGPFVTNPSNTSLPAQAASNQAKEYIFSHADLPGLLSKVLKGNTAKLDGQEYPLPFSQAAWDYAQDTQAAWKQARLPEGCQFYNLYGTGLTTPYDVQYGSWWNPVKVS